MVIVSKEKGKMVKEGGVASDGIKGRMGMDDRMHH